jgi:GntR family transcriptional regulator
MFFEIDPASGIPIYEQVARQVKFAVAGGVVAEGEPIPSVREVARELAINPNTVARAYRDLQSDGVLASVRGARLAVAAGAVARCLEERLRLVAERVRQALVESLQAGLTAEQLQTIVEQQLASLNGQEVRR